MTIQTALITVVLVLAFLTVAWAMLTGGAGQPTVTITELPPYYYQEQFVHPDLAVILDKPRANTPIYDALAIELNYESPVTA